MAARIDRVVTSGTFSLDGEDFAVDNNIWLVGDDTEVLIIDAAHDAAPIAAAVAGRRVVAIVCTHGHNDHINAAVALAATVAAPILLHAADTMLWQAVYPDRPFDGSLVDGEDIRVAGSRLRIMHTPGHSPGGVCLYDDSDGVLFSGDTLFKGGPGATGRSYSDRAVLLKSITQRLLPMPLRTVVHTGHGEDTTLGAEAPGIVAELQAAKDAKLPEPRQASTPRKASEPWKASEPRKAHEPPDEPPPTAQ